jgi:hypothetical protein
MLPPMTLRTTLFAAALALAPVTLLGAAGCSSDTPEKTERWATTENTNVDIDFDKVNEAYKTAEGPEDFEKKVNEIYEGDEIISVSVQDLDNKVQVVTGFFDKDKNGSVEDPEKIFTIKRELTGEGAAQVQTTGHGAYGYYHSPMMSMVTGMVLGSMLSSAFSPRYVPVYSQPYTTSPTRANTLSSQRSSYRAQNPTRFDRSKASSGTGRRYNNTGTRSWGSSGRSSGGRSGGGGRFGLRRAGLVRAARLTA